MNALQLEARTSSAVSQVLRRIQSSELGDVPQIVPGAHAALEQFEVSPAADRLRREQAYRLAYEAYHKKGYIPGADTGVLAAPYDAQPDTLTILATEQYGARRPAGTVSVIFDSSVGLPSDEIFHAEVEDLRENGRWVIEVCRLAIAPEHANSRELLALLCCIPLAYATQIRGFTDMVLEVNPRHVPFYRRLLKFGVLGAERPCPRVNAAPAVLLHLDMVALLPLIQRLQGRGSACQERSLYPHFLDENSERDLIQRLAGQHRPMTVAEMRAFNLALPQHRYQRFACIPDAY